MKDIPNNIISDLCRYLPMLIANIDTDAVKKSTRIENAIRIIRYKIIPKLKKIEKSEKLRNGK